MKMKSPNRHGKAERPSTMSRGRPQLRDILTTTDFSEEARVGVRYAVALAKRLGAGVALLHVIEPPPRMAGMEAVVLAREDAETIALARGHLAQLGKRENQGAVTLASLVRIGKPFHEITTAARERAADLIVIATHGYTGAKRALLGSTTERVVRHAGCPVLAVPTRSTSKRRGSSGPLKLKRILVPVDFSDTAKDALPWAAFLAAPFGAEIILFHVVEKLPIGAFWGRVRVNETTAVRRKHATADLELLAESVRKASGLSLSVLVHEGKPFQEICTAANTLGADLIVLTTHGYTGLKHVWLGSTSERVVRHADCPVLAVRKPSSWGMRGG